MAVDKLVDSSQLDSDLTSVANAIRSKTGGSASLAFPSGYVAAINSIPIYTVRTITKTLTNTTTSNSATSVIDGSSYYCELTPADGYMISSVTVTMGGVDITSQVFTGGIGGKAIVANGIYNASDDNLLGYSTVNVSIPLGAKTINSNGIYNASSDSLDGYSRVTVNVPNAYTSSDEGKVVSNGALVSQGSDTVTSNGTYDTTLINSLTVSLSGGYTLDTFCERSFSVSNVVLSTATSIKPFTFTNNTSLQSISAPLVTSFTESRSGNGSYVFAWCTGLTSVNLPLLSGVGSGGYQFAYCTGLTTINLPCAFIGQYMFRSCTNLVTAVIGYNRTSNVQGNGNGFNGCTKLKTVDWSYCSRVYNSEFSGCTVFDKLIIRTSSVATLSNINAFSNSPFASGKSGGTLYVPSSLVSSYQSASNWSTILGYTNNQIKSIESTHTDSTAPFDMTLYYADGTAVSS